MLTTKSGRGGFFSPQEKPEKSKAQSCTRFGNLTTFENWREARKSQGINNALESHRNYMINKNKSYKVDPCFNGGRAQADVFKVPAGPSTANAAKAFSEVTFRNMRSPQVQRINRNEMSVSFKIPDEKSEAKKFLFSGRNERSLQALR